MNNEELAQYFFNVVGQNMTSNARVVQVRRHAKLIRTCAVNIAQCFQVTNRLPALAVSRKDKAVLERILNEGVDKVKGAYYEENAASVQRDFMPKKKLKNIREDLLPGSEAAMRRDEDS